MLSPGREKAGDRERHFPRWQRTVETEWLIQVSEGQETENVLSQDSKGPKTENGNETENVLSQDSKGPKTENGLFR